MSRLAFLREAPNVVGLVGTILALAVIVILIFHGMAWYMAALLGFGTIAVFASVALLLRPSSRQPKP